MVMRRGHGRKPLDDIFDPLWAVLEIKTTFVIYLPNLIKFNVHMYSIMAVSKIKLV